MQVIRSEVDLERVVVDAEVRRLIDLRIGEAKTYVARFEQAVFFVLIEPGDGLDAADQQLGFSLIPNRTRGSAPSARSLAPTWGLIEEHDGCFELKYELSNDGSVVVVFIPKGDGVRPELSEMCRRYVTEGAGL